MNKIIITETQLKKVIDNFINEEDSSEQVNIVNVINTNFDRFQQNFEKQIKTTNNIINMDVLIANMKNYVTTNTPNILKQNIKPEDYINKYYQFLMNNFNQEASKLGWGKRSLAKGILGKPEEAKAKIDTWKLKDIIWNILYLGNLPTGINNDWTNSYNNIVNTNKLRYYEPLRDKLVATVFS